MKSSNLQKILSNTNQYPPSEDTFFLADNIENEKGFSALDHKFDLIVCNMPYLATDEIVDITTDGGIDGLEIPTKIIQSAKLCLNDQGKFLFVTSTLSNYKELIEFVKLQGMNAEIISRKKLFFEELLLICAEN